jgi:GTP 3',8-cyclase
MRNSGHDLRAPLRERAGDEALGELITRIWTGRADRGAEDRLALRDRTTLIPATALRRNPHLEMHTKGG